MTEVQVHTRIWQKHKIIFAQLFTQYLHTQWNAFIKYVMMSKIPYFFVILCE